MIEKLYKIAEGLTVRFPDGDDPFKIVTRLAEECGEVAAEVNHFEGQGVKVEKRGPPDRNKFAKELQHVVGAVLQLARYYGLQAELEASVDRYYRRVVDEGLVAPPVEGAMILHITRREAWEHARGAGRYEADTLASQGFIHCSAPEQVIRVADAFYRGQKDLVLLVIDSARVEAEIRYENLEGGEERFPHIYGPLNVEAVVRVADFEPGPDGAFTLPKGIRVGSST
jgi:uncharacterized protein (DUF952 family)/NTP pyrophosphatase (non-canonical NTP hydrolase)